MANWSNIRLIAVGPQREIAGLRKIAKPFLALARKRWRLLSDPPLAASNPVPLFSADMIFGECSHLIEEPTKRFVNGTVRAEHIFQTS
jgi:hypothetical protein